MDLAQSLQTNYVLLEADWPADHSRKLVRDLPATSVTHVIVHWDDPGAGAEYYGLFTRKEALDLLILGGTVREALDLREENAAPVLDPAVSLSDAPQRVVVVKDGEVLGFVDKDLLTFGALVGGEMATGNDAATGTRGGVTVDQEVEFDDPFANIGLELHKAIPAMRNDGADDGPITVDDGELERSAPPARPRPRFLNTGFFVGNGTEPAQESRPVASDEPLALDQGPQWLGVNIGQFWGVGIPNAVFPDNLLETHYDETDALELDVQVTSPAIDVEPATTKLSMPRNGNSRIAFFKASFRQPGRHIIEIDVLFRGHLLQSKEVEVYVLAQSGDRVPDGEWPVQDAHFTFSRTGTLESDEMAALAAAPRRLTVIVQRDPDDTTIRLRFHDSGGDELALYETDLTDANLTTLLTEVRGALQSTMNAYIPDVGGDLVKLAKQLGPLAEKGAQFRRALLPSDDGDDQPSPLRLEPGQIIQVAPLSSQVGVPWELLYERRIETYQEGQITLCPTFLEHGPEPDACPSHGDSKVVCPHGFWGYRYVIEQLPNRLKKGEQPGGALPPLRIENDVPLRLTAVLYTSFDLVDAHLSELEALAATTQLAVSRVDSKDEVRDALTSKEHPADVLYFYTHGDVATGAASLKVGPKPGELLKQGDLEAWEVDLKHHRPLIVLNACTSGASSPTQFESLIKDLSDRGAAGVIGTQCFVEEPLAGHFILRFFQEFLKQQTVGQALFEARRALLHHRASGSEGEPRPDPRGLAYSLFAAADVSLSEAVLT